MERAEGEVFGCGGEVDVVMLRGCVEVVLVTRVVWVDFPKVSVRRSPRK